MTNEEHNQYLCDILAKLVPCKEITGTELADLSSALGIRVDEFYASEEPILNVIEWKDAA